MFRVLLPKRLIWSEGVSRRSKLTSFNKPGGKTRSFGTLRHPNMIRLMSASGAKADIQNERCYVTE
jgi:hypothetical protein